MPQTKRVSSQIAPRKTLKRPKLRQPIVKIQPPPFGRGRNFVRHGSAFLTGVRQSKPSLFNDPFFALTLRVWIFLPVYNFSAFLDDCFRSVESQTYPNVHLVIVDDGSTDGSAGKIRVWIPRFKRRGYTVDVLTNIKNQGGGYTKWQAIEFIRTRAFKQDVFTILDGDDQYATPVALETIVTTYLNTKCWMTYGSTKGRFARQSAPLEPKELDALRIHPSKNTFKFQHPRSCFCFLLDSFTESDFKDELHQWLRRATDVQLLYKMLELAGEDRVAFISKRLYSYRQHANNARRIVGEDSKLRHLAYLKTLPVSSPLFEPIHIVMCCYNRHENIAKILQSIDAQTVADRIVFHIVHTNPDPRKWNQLKEIVVATPVKRIRVRTTQTHENLFGFARFLYVKQLLRTTIVPYVVFIDDDQAPHPTWVANLWNQRAPFRYACWFGRIFPDTGRGDAIDYWKGVVSIDPEFQSPRYRSVTEFDYGGTGGCIVDANVFLFSMVFQCPRQYRNIEDLWLSFVVKQILGGVIHVVRDPLARHVFSNEHRTALYKTLKPEKTAFLGALVQCGYLHKGFSSEPLRRLLDKDDSDSLLLRFRSS